MIASDGTLPKLPIELHTSDIDLIKPLELEKIMKIAAIVQARMNSTRLPGKVLKHILNKPLIELLLTRLSQSSKLDEIIVATSEDPQNDKLQSIIESLGYRCTRGSEKDVLNRFYETAKKIHADVIVRITGDCPLVDSALVDKCIQCYKDSNVDYFSNTNPRSFPDGLDIEVFSFSSIEYANKEAVSKFDREHVTPFIINSDRFLKSSLQNKENLSNLRWTVDEQEDLNVITNIFEYFSSNINFNWNQVLELQIKKPELFLENKNP
jgi:glutamate-1-semialdehyde 2,1-aminomutase